jgi:hypothetical protein
MTRSCFEFLQPTDRLREDVISSGIVCWQNKMGFLLPICRIIWYLDACVHFNPDPLRTIMNLRQTGRKCLTSTIAPAIALKFTGEIYSVHSDTKDLNDATRNAFQEWLNIYSPSNEN